MTCVATALYVAPGHSPPAVAHGCSILILHPQAQSQGEQYIFYFYSIKSVYFIYYAQYEAAHYAHAPPTAFPSFLPLLHVREEEDTAKL